MQEDTVQENTVAEGAAPAAAPSAALGHAPRAGGFQRRDRGGPRGGHGGGDRRGGAGGDRRGRGGPRRERVRSEFDNKMIAIRRVARVVAGGRRFSFSVAMVIGDRKGSVGVGLGKGADTALAIEKATRDAKKHMITVPLTKEGSIAHDVEAKVGPSWIVIRPSSGRGLVAGSSVRTVLELAGVRDISARVLSRSKNRLNNARAAIAALKQVSPPKYKAPKEAPDAAKKAETESAEKK